MKNIKSKIAAFGFSLVTLMSLSPIALATSDCDKVTDSKQLQTCVHNNQIVIDLQNIVNFLSAGVALVVISMLIIGGIQYSMAGDNAQAVSAAKQRITNALIGLVAFIFTFAFLQWLIPGGIFG